MADYIYLLQHRLTSPQRRSLESVRDAARHLAAPVFLVGGAVRDLTSGAPVRDLDFAIQFAVQGDVAELAEALIAAGARLLGEDKVLQSHYFVFPGGVRVEVGPTLAVTYPKPGVPEAQPAPILDDLRRRDFTVNAMAISLNEGSYGLLLDPLNGVADLENHELRLVSNLGFIEQPALLLRAARLSHRLGWNLEERTQRRYENAKEEDAIARLPAAARGYELEEIFHEEDPIAAIAYLGSEQWLGSLSEVLGGLKPDQDGLDRVRDTLGQMEQLGIFADPSAVYFPLIVAKLPAAEVSGLKAAFARQGFSERIDSLESRSRELASQLTAKAAAMPSATWKLLFEADPEVVLALASSTKTGAIQTKFKAFFTEWPQARQRTPYAVMQEMRITPELPGYDQLLQDLFFAIMDNRLSTPEETRAFLEPFSPPAPAQQITPRRRAAKSARGRGRPAAAASSKTPDADLEEDDEDMDAEPKSRRSSREDDEEDESDADEAETGRRDGSKGSDYGAESSEDEDDDSKNDSKDDSKERDKGDDNDNEDDIPSLRPPARQKTAAKKTSSSVGKSSVVTTVAPAKVESAVVKALGGTKTAPTAKTAAAEKTAAAVSAPVASPTTVVAAKAKLGGAEKPQPEPSSLKGNSPGAKKAVAAPVKAAAKAEAVAVKAGAKSVATRAPAKAALAVEKTAGTAANKVAPEAKTAVGEKAVAKKTAAAPVASSKSVPAKQVVVVQAKKVAGKAIKTVPAKKTSK